MTAMFLSSCYWPPVPLETSLSTPWSPNITTFSEALLSMVPEIPPELMPTEIPIVEHCWCDFASGRFFEPFNITQWEMNSVEKVKEEIVKKIREEGKAAESRGAEETSVDEEKTVAVREMSTISKLTSMWGTVWPFTRTLQAEPTSANATGIPSSKTESIEVEDIDHKLTVTSPRLLPRPSFFRKEYDLRPYGFGMVVDFGWSSDVQ